MYLLKSVFLNNKTVDILIDNNRFLRIASEIKPDSNTNVINCQNRAILPSCANMHTHAAMMFLRGIGEDKNLFDWLNQDIWPREAKLNDEFVYHLSKFAMLEMIKSGTTLFNDMYFYEKSTVNAVQEMGIRAVVPHLFMDFFDEYKTNEHLQVAEQFLQQDCGDDKIIKSVACHAIYTTSPHAFEIAYELAHKYNTFLHLHISETQQEVDDCVHKYSVRPIELLNNWGVLDDKTILAHAVHLDDKEINILHNTQSVLVHCPASNMKLNSGTFNFQKCLDAGLKITLGTDGVSSNNSLSMFSEMKVAALLAKISANSECAGRVVDIFNAAGFNGFAALGLKSGKIQEGFFADFILVDLDNVFLLPGHNLYSDVIYSGDTSCITDVFCNGVPVMRNKMVKNEEQIKNNFIQACKRLM